MIFGIVPPEPPAITSLDGLAPKFLAAVLSVIPNLETQVRETLRTSQRQMWLYYMGREYDDGRGIVTNAVTIADSWHGYGLALDLLRPPVPTLAAHLRDANLALGLDWPTFPDPPHIQWGVPMRRSPSIRAVQLDASGGLPAVWQEVLAA